MPGNRCSAIASPAPDRRPDVERMRQPAVRTERHSRLVEMPRRPHAQARRPGRSRSGDSVSSSVRPTERERPEQTSGPAARQPPSDGRSRRSTAPTSAARRPADIRWRVQRGDSGTRRRVARIVSAGAHGRCDASDRRCRRWACRGRGHVRRTGGAGSSRAEIGAARSVIESRRRQRRAAPRPLPARAVLARPPDDRFQAVRAIIARARRQARGGPPLVRPGRPGLTGVAPGRFPHGAGDLLDAIDRKLGPGGTPTSQKAQVHLHVNARAISIRRHQDHGIRVKGRASRSRSSSTRNRSPASRRRSAPDRRLQQALGSNAASSGACGGLRIAVSRRSMPVPRIQKSRYLALTSQSCARTERAASAAATGWRGRYRSRADEEGSPGHANRWSLVVGRLSSSRSHRTRTTLQVSTIAVRPHAWTVDARERCPRCSGALAMHLGPDPAEGARRFVGERHDVSTAPSGDDLRALAAGIAGRQAPTAPQTHLVHRHDQSIGFGRALRMRTWPTCGKSKQPLARQSSARRAVVRDGLSNSDSLAPVPRCPPF